MIGVLWQARDAAVRLLLGGMVNGFEQQAQQQVDAIVTAIRNETEDVAQAVCSAVLSRA